tara:strand:- start:2330 stop:3346 length:1017 start_codon:yes stop_codon:yes gene_type:complete
MSEKKLLNINPDLFSVSSFNNKTRKGGKKVKPKEKIKVKPAISSNEKDRQKTLKKRSLLKMIRQQQQNNYDKMFDKKQEKTTKSFGNEFEKATEFLDNLVKNQSTSVIPKNTTLKNTTVIPEIPKINMPVLPDVSSEMVNLNFPTLDNTTPFQIKPQFNSSSQPLPSYGCLKNGSLPTYRNLMNKTIKHGGASEPITQQDVEEKQLEIQNKIKEKSTILQQQNMNKKLFPKKRKRATKQRRTIKRKYNVGKSKTKPKISVLVSNKTIRNKISTKKQLLKQESIPDIKRYLVKHGFIKVGSTTPNDILRKMYESALLICGEVTNHNPDNLLYNFMNVKE